jgi:hypothetical protein
MSLCLLHPPALIQNSGHEEGSSTEGSWPSRMWAKGRGCAHKDVFSLSVHSRDGLGLGLLWALTPYLLEKFLKALVFLSPLPPSSVSHYTYTWHCWHYPPGL